MAASSDEMRRMLESVRKVIRARTIDPTAATATTRTTAARAAGHDTRSVATTSMSPPPSSSSLGAGPAVLVRSAQNSAALNARDNEGEFARYYHRLLLSFVEDKTKYELELPNLGGFDRLVVHALAEQCNLSHQSVGEGAQRVLRLKKDVLFFHQPEAARHVDLDALMARLTSKESKYHLRRVRGVDAAALPVGEVGSYADEDAARKVARLRRATDEYRHATEMGYTQEELMAAERGGGGGCDNDGGGDEGERDAQTMLRVEDVLRRRRDDDDDGDGDTTRTKREGDAHKRLAAAATTATAAAAGVTVNTVYDEVCRACGTRARVNGDVRTWTCSKYCATCLRQTIWTLLEVATTGKDGGSGDKSKATAAATAATTVTTTTRAKRARDTGDDETVEDALLPAPSRHRLPEEIDKDDDHDDEDERITVDDAVEMAAMNDFSIDDMNWIRRFATLHAANLQRHLVFCIDFADLAELHIFRRYEQQQQQQQRRLRPRIEAHRRNDSNKDKDKDDGELPVCYVVVTESTTLHTRVTALLQRVIADAFRASVAAHAEDADDATAAAADTRKGADDDDAVLRRAAGHVAIAFRNVSVYGVECTAVCQLRAYAPAAATTTMVQADDSDSGVVQQSHLRIDAAALHGLQRHYGLRHCAIAHTLDEALQHLGVATLSSSLAL